jgi:hypothetical protein
MNISSAFNGGEAGSYLEPEPPSAHPVLSGFRPDRRLRWKPPDQEELGRGHIVIVRLKANGMSSLYSPGPEAVLSPPLLHPASSFAPAGHSCIKTRLFLQAQPEPPPPVVVNNTLKIWILLA